MRILRDCKIFILLFSGIFILEILAFSNKDGAYREYSLDSDPMVPAFTWVLRGLSEEVYPWTAYEPMEELCTAEEKEENGGKELSIPLDLFAGAKKQQKNDSPLQTGFFDSVEKNVPTGKGDVLSAALFTPEDLTEEVQPNEETENGSETADAPDASGDTECAENAEIGSVENAEEKSSEHVNDSVDETALQESPEENSEESSISENEGTIPQSEDDIPVLPENLFENALFIGDSRTVGMEMYGEFGPETDFFAATSTNIYQFFEKPKSIAHTLNGSKCNLEKGLSEKQYSRIFIMVGINEIGSGTTSSFFTSYANAVNRIRQLQPDAVIYIQAIMKVGEKKARSESRFNIEGIEMRNQAIASLADGKKVFYIDINQAVCDESGYLIEEYSFDEVHLKAKYYVLWKNYLLENCPL